MEGLVMEWEETGDGTLSMAVGKPRVEATACWVGGEVRYRARAVDGSSGSMEEEGGGTSSRGSLDTL